MTRGPVQQLSRLCAVNTTVRLNSHAGHCRIRPSNGSGLLLPLTSKCCLLDVYGTSLIVSDVPRAVASLTLKSPYMGSLCHCSSHIFQCVSAWLQSLQRGMWWSKGNTAAEMTSAWTAWVPLRHTFAHCFQSSNRGAPSQSHERTIVARQVACHGQHGFKKPSPTCRSGLSCLLHATPSIAQLHVWTSATSPNKQPWVKGIRAVFMRLFATPGRTWYVMLIQTSHAHPLHQSHIFPPSRSILEHHFTYQQTCGSFISGSWHSFTTPSKRNNTASLLARSRGIPFRSLLLCVPDTFFCIPPCNLRT